MYKIEFTNQYLKDLKLARKRNLDESKLNELILILLADKDLPQKYKDHRLTGNLKGFNECHISPDWLLIYEKDTTVRFITLIRMGSHSDLF
jgi:mRNA interferase YafQ